MKCQGNFNKTIWYSSRESPSEESYVFPEWTCLIPAIFSHWLGASNGKWCFNTNHSDGFQSTEPGVIGQLIPADIWKEYSQGHYSNKPNKALNWYSNQVYAMNLTKVQETHTHTNSIMCTFFSHGLSPSIIIWLLNILFYH